MAYEPWPSYKPELTQDPEFELAVQVNGKIKDKITVSAESDEESIKQKALSSAKVQAETNGKDIRKVIVIKNRLVNIVAS